MGEVANALPLTPEELKIVKGYKGDAATAVLLEDKNLRSLQDAPRAVAKPLNEKGQLRPFGQCAESHAYETILPGNHAVETCSVQYVGDNVVKTVPRCGNTSP